MSAWDDDHEGDARYLSIDLLQSNPSPAADVFSFGIMLLELTSGVSLPGPPPPIPVALVSLLSDLGRHPNVDRSPDPDIYLHVIALQDKATIGISFAVVFSTRGTLTPLLGSQGTGSTSAPHASVVYVPS